MWMLFLSGKNWCSFSFCYTIKEKPERLRTERHRPRRGGLNAARRRCELLDFVGSFLSRKKNGQEKGLKPVNCQVMIQANLWLLVFMFFLLEQKEPKIQDKPNPSGRFVGLTAPGRRPTASIERVQLTCKTSTYRKDKRD